MSSNIKKSFVFHFEWKEVLEGYPAEVRLEVYDAIIEYAASGTVVELKPLAKMAFSFIRKQIDYNNERYNEIVAKRSEAGKKGMASRYSVNKLTNDNKINKNYQEITNITDNDNVIEYDNDSIEMISPKKEILERKKEDSVLSCKDVVDEFNSQLAPPLPKVVKITEQRKRAIKSRINEHGQNSISEVFKKIKESDFLLGKTENGWMCSFDWVFCPRNFIKILEGNYANNRSVNSDKRRANEEVFNQFISSRQQESGYVAHEVEKPF